MKKTLLVLPIIISFGLPWKDTVQAVEKEILIHCMSPQSDLNRRQLFVHEIIKAVMDATISSHGPYRIKSIPKMAWPGWILFLVKTDFQI